MKIDFPFEILKIGARTASVFLFRTRYFPREAWKYWLYWKKCQWSRTASREISNGARNGHSSAITQAAAHFRQHKFCVYRDEETIAAAARAKAYLAPWFNQQHATSYAVDFKGADPWEIDGVQDLFNGHLRQLIESIFGAHFKIFYGKALRSVPLSTPPTDGYNSFMWHADGGPPSCVNMMLYLDETDKSNGAIEFAPPDLSVRVMAKSVSTWRNIDREERTRRFTKAIEQNGIVQTAIGHPGSVVLFSNNILHRGGLTLGSRSRDVLIFHLYPAMRPFTGKSQNLTKVAPVPARPDF